MAYIVGYITKAERKELERRGWEVEYAKDYDMIGDSDKHLLSPTDPDIQAVVIFVDANVFQVMDGPDWEKGQSAN